MTTQRSNIKHFLNLKVYKAADLSLVFEVLARPYACQWD